MRNAAIALIATLALAACGQQQAAAPGAETGGGLADAFPNLLQASYRAEATIANPNGGDPLQVVMIRSGNKQRWEMNSNQGAQTIIVDPDADASFVIANVGGRRMAVRTDSFDIPDAGEAWASELGATATRAGVCTVAGETGSEWTSDDSDGPNTACVTDDGIVLRATEHGAVTWETTSVVRGPQDPALFTVPAGVQVMNVPNMGGAMQDALEKAKAAANR